MIETGEAWGLWERESPVASALTLAYGKRFAWISMVLVNSRWRRRGIATELLRAAIERLRRQHLIAGLDATEAGRKVYLPLGFNEIYPLSRLLLARSKPSEQKHLAGPEGIRIQPLNLDALPGLADWDARIFGAKRLNLLAALYHRLPQCAHIAYAETGQIAGFVLGRDGRGANQIGPLVAASEPLAKALLHNALAALNGAVLIDAVTFQHAWLRFLQAQGFARQRGFMRMLLGRDKALDDATRIFAVAGPELG